MHLCFYPVFCIWNFALLCYFFFFWLYRCLWTWYVHVLSWICRHKEVLFKNVQADLQYLEGREVMESEGASECAALCLQVDMDPDSIPSFQMFNPPWQNFYTRYCLLHSWLTMWKAVLTLAERNISLWFVNSYYKKMDNYFLDIL